jgi:hypothetical protein
MFDDNFNENVCLSSPGLAIAAGTSPLVKYSNTFTFKANGRISASITTANAPALSLATLIGPFPNGTAAIAGSLATGFTRGYTLVATLPINGTSTAAATFSWLASSDAVATTDLANTSLFATPNASNQTAIGFVLVSNGTGSAFVPGTTALDTSSLTVTYINNFGMIGS